MFPKASCFYKARLEPLLPEGPAGVMRFGGFLILRKTLLAVPGNKGGVFLSIFAQGFQSLLNEPFSFLLMTFGVFFGIIFGCIPGLTATLGVILLIPVTYAMSPVMGFSMLLGIYVGGISGGLITATLLNIPGTPSSIFTCWDAYPMSKNGQPGQALSIGVFSSLIGGLFSAVALIFIAPQLAKVALQFGNWELFGLTLMAMCIIAVMTEGDPLRSSIGLVFGLVLASIGLDSLTGQQRLTFGSWQLLGGLASTSIMMGLFAITEILMQTRELSHHKQKVSTKGMSFKPPVKALKGCWRTMGVGSVIGTFIGILPAIGQQTASLVTYNYAKSTSKTPERFGKGNPEGIVASETANNAVCGGALIPLITLGIPGDMTTAALLGGLMIHGLQPGPLLFSSNPGIIGAIMLIFLMCNLVMYLMELGLMRVFIRLIDLPRYLLFPFIVFCCILGVYALNNRIFDIWVLLVFGLLGYLFTLCKVPLSPIIMGYLMGKTFEVNFRRAMISAQGDFGDLFNRPIAALFLAASILFVLIPVGLRILRRAKKSGAATI